MCDQGGLHLNAVLGCAGRNAAASEGGGVTGPKNIGVRELTYRLAFLASSVQVEGPSKLNLHVQLSSPAVGSACHKPPGLEDCF